VDKGGVAPILVDKGGVAPIPLSSFLTRSLPLDY